MQRLQRFRIDRDDARLLAAFAADEAAGQADIVDVEADELADTDARGIQDLEHGLVAAALHLRDLRLLQQKLDLFAGQDLRQLFFCLVDLDVVDRVLLDLTVLDGEYVQTLDGGPRTGDRRGGFSVGLHAVHVAGNHVLIGVQHIDAFGAQI